MKKRIGFIGLGIMGKPMAKNLLKAGYELAVYDVRPEPVEEPVEDLPGPVELLPAHREREVGEDEYELPLGAARGRLRP